MSGFPLPPLCDMLGSEPEAAKKNATYYGQDMNFMIWIGEKVDHQQHIPHSPTELTSHSSTPH